MFVSYDAAKYRALTDADFEQRKSDIIDMMKAETLPEGVTDDMLYEERDIIMAEIDRRNKLESLRNAKLDKVVTAAKRVDNNQPAKQERGFQVVSESRFDESIEYRRALAQHIMHRQEMPADMIARVRQERAAGDPIAVSFADGYTNVTDPTFGAGVVSTPIPIPLTLSDEIVRVRKEYGILHPLVNETYYPGGYAIPVADLSVDYHWINDKQVSPYQYDGQPAVISFTWHELECRFARTFLAEALMRDNFKQLLAPALAEGYGRAMDTAILNGNGTTQPLGLLNDPRFIDQTPGANTGNALVVQASSDDLSDWAWWTKLLFNPAFNRLYRGDGQWIIGDSTFGTYIQTLKDEVNRPLVQLNLQSGDNLPTIRGNAINTVPVSLLPDFDAASVGDVVAIFGNMRNYTLNFQPGMPLTTVSWDDHETNTHKTKVLTAVDGKLVDNNGWVVITKKAQG